VTPRGRLQQHLAAYRPDDWRRAVDVLAPAIHEIDRNATRIWFAFYPLELHLAAGQADDHEAFARQYGLMGRWRLADHIDTSHRFLFAHRYWPQVKTNVQTFAEPFPRDLPALVTAAAEAAARTARVDPELLLGITAVALMTLRQVGTEAFEAAPGTIHLDPSVRARSPHQILRRRARDDWQGPLGFLRGLKKRWTVTFDENTPGAGFTMITEQEIASAAQTDTRDYRALDPRCTPGEGPIPVECRAASCGTCWVGVLGGAEKLSPVHPRDEGRRLDVFGYSAASTDESAGDRPLIRLACQARGSGAVSVVIPPWNGMIGKLIRR
jgi:ferredoxin